MTAEQLAQLEALVDQLTLRTIVTGLATVCAAKAEHIDYAWQDRNLARKWRKASRMLETCARKMEL